MYVETKETSFEQLESCIDTMNKVSYWKNPIRGYSSTISKNIANKNIENREGYAYVRKILKKYHVTTLYELNKEQIDCEILLLHKSVIRKLKTGAQQWRKNISQT